jgi:hypothetical protein
MIESCFTFSVRCLATRNASLVMRRRVDGRIDSDSVHV